MELYHQFECIESGVAFELYWATFTHDDIVRETVVGKMKKVMSRWFNRIGDIDKWNGHLIAGLVYMKDMIMHVFMLDKILLSV